MDYKTDERGILTERSIDQVFEVYRELQLGGRAEMLPSYQDHLIAEAQHQVTLERVRERVNALDNPYHPSSILGDKGNTRYLAFEACRQAMLEALGEKDA